MKTSRILLALGIVIGAVGAGAWVCIRSLSPQLELGVGYAARVACGCRFIEGRSLASCHSDFEKGMEPIRLSEDVAAKSVTAYVPLIASRTARLDPVLGCQPDRYAGPPRVVKR